MLYLEQCGKGGNKDSVKNMNLQTKDELRICVYGGIGKGRQI